MRPPSRVLGTIGIPDSRGEEYTVAAMRPSSWEPGAILIPSSGGKERIESTVVTMRPSSRGPRAMRVPGSRREEHIEHMVSMVRASSAEPGAICAPRSRAKRATPAPETQRSVHGTDVLPLSAIRERGISNVPLLGSHVVREIPGWRLLGLRLGADP